MGGRVTTRGTMVAASLLAAALVAAGAAVHAQDPAGARGGVRGEVRDAEGRGVAGARVEVVGSQRAGESDASGGYEVSGLGLGQARLLIRRIGFSPESLLLQVEGPRTMAPAVVLRRVGDLMQPVVVQGRRDLKGPMAGFYARMERGQGRFFTESQLEKLRSPRMTDLLRRIPGLGVSQRKFGTTSVRMRGSWVAPLVWLDGVPMGAGEVDLDNFDPRTFAGIEVYSGSATVPMEFAGTQTMTTSGGTIILWTRQGRLSPPRRGPDQPSPSSVIARLLERDEAFTRDEVDTPARALGESEVTPMYPDSLFNARIAGQIEVEFIVDHRGQPRMDTFGVVATTHAALEEAVRRAIQSRVFLPATRGGVSVAQLVQQPFRFEPDGRASARKPQD